MGRGIDVLDPGDALDDALQRLGDQLDRILGPQTRRLHMDIHQRHRDLRLFLARQRAPARPAHRKRREDEQRRQRRGDERPRQPPGNARR